MSNEYHAFANTRTLWNFQEPTILMHTKINISLTDIVKILCFTIFLFNPKQIIAQCDSSFKSINTTSTQQLIDDISISLSSTTNAQERRLLNGLITGYYIGDENISEEITFNLSKPVTKIKIIGRALSAAFNKIEYFTIKINGQYHFIQGSELITPDPLYGEECYLQPNGSILGDTLRNGDGTFIFTYQNNNGISSFQIMDSITSLNPEGAVFDVQIYTTCKNDTSITGVEPPFFIPTAFSPNNDGKNDTFKPIISGNIIKYEFYIFNSWGQNVFKSFDKNIGWDGLYLRQDQEQGLFVWLCNYQGEGQPLRTRKGTFLLLR